MLTTLPADKRFTVWQPWKEFQEPQGRMTTVKRNYLAAALSLLLAVGTMPGVLAADEPLEKVVDSSLLVTRVGGVGAGLVLGTPVAVTRCTVKSYKDLTVKVADKIGGKTGGKDCGPCCLIVSVATLPAGIVWGGLTGSYYGGKNAFKVGFNQPFHPDSFSLGKLED
jgi:hypothetical protein